MDFKSEIREEQNKQQLTIDPINWNDNYHHIEPQYRYFCLCHREFSTLVYYIFEINRYDMNFE